MRSKMDVLDEYIRQDIAQAPRVHLWPSGKERLGHMQRTKQPQKRSTICRTTVQLMPMGILLRSCVLKIGQQTLKQRVEEFPGGFS
jgi:hypothetical protein